MYERHFGLTQRPFRESLDLASFVELPSRRAILRRLAYALEDAGGVALLFGAPGSGKSIVARRLMAASGFTPVLLPYPAMPAPSLIAYLATELNALPRRDQSRHVPDLSLSVRAVRDAYSEILRRGSRPLLVVDDAHLIEDRRTLDALRLVLNLANPDGPAPALLLVGEPELILNLPAGLSDRLAARCLLRPLVREESDEYLHSRYQHAGGTDSPFTSEALAALHNASEGLPRRLNRLADLALLVAAAENLPVIKMALIDHLITDELDDPLAA